MITAAASPQASPRRSRSARSETSSSRRRASACSKSCSPSTGPWAPTRFSNICAPRGSDRSRRWALEFLTKNGFAHRIERLNAFIACSHLDNAHAPVFLICRACERVVEAEANAAQGEIDRVARRAGFVVERAVREAEGLCPACAPTA
jgi:hypothetical protein